MLRDNQSNSVTVTWRCSSTAYKFGRTALRRFLAKVEIRGVEECWPWLANKTWQGYGRFWTGYASVPAHVVAWMLANGRAFPRDEPWGLHSCDNPSCCNPNHVYPGTHQKNMADRTARGRNRLCGVRW